MKEAKTRRFGRVYSAVDQILNPDVDKVVVIDEPGMPPAWTDGMRITINQAAMPPLHKGTQLDLATWIGINAHELAHSIFTPREKTPLMARVRAVTTAYPSLRKVLNIMADQRDERLMIAQYPPLKVYLLAAARHFFDREYHEGSQVWALLAGRTWVTPRYGVVRTTPSRVTHWRWLASSVHTSVLVTQVSTIATRPSTC